MDSVKKKKLLKLIRDVDFYSVSADFPKLKNLFNYTMTIFQKYLAFNEVDEISCEMLGHFVHYEKLQPPRAIPSNLDSNGVPL